MQSVHRGGCSGRRIPQEQWLLARQIAVHECELVHVHPGRMVQRTSGLLADVTDGIGSRWGRDLCAAINNPVLLRRLQNPSSEATHPLIKVPLAL